jgi:GNAT superfamily N-acetyltransferase
VPAVQSLTVSELIRPLEPADAAEVAALESAARAALVEQRGGAAHLREVPVVGDWSGVPTTWVAVFDDLVVGYLQLVVADDTAAVHQVYVRPEARELGFGDWLLEAAVQHAREAGCTCIEGTALPGDRDTKNLYERAGITARKIVVSKPL